MGAVASVDQGKKFPVLVEAMSSDSVDELVEVHLEAFDGYMNAALGRGYVRAFLLWFCDASDGIALTAWLDGRVVGYVVGAPVGYNSRMTRDLFRVVLRSMVCRPWLGARRDIRAALSARLRLLKGPGGHHSVGLGPKGTYGSTVSLVGIGVAEAARGRGAGGALMKAFESEALKRGMQAMRLTVYRDNVAACRVYQRAGWDPSSAEAESTICYRKPIAGSLRCS
ncbi:MAG: GNAT family N-acetyltransferase [Thermoanaerobaculales bacterium]|nr:GNAT family N-acetyltransferase [Thermoanaerobaculales bacterium]